MFSRKSSVEKKVASFKDVADCGYFIVNGKLEIEGRILGIRFSSNGKLFDITVADLYKSGTKKQLSLGDMDRIIVKSFNDKDKYVDDYIIKDEVLFVREPKVIELLLEKLIFKGLTE